jgi:hypothetical protein
MKSKLIIFPILAVLALSSCKRSYVCECTLFDISNNQFKKISASEETLGKLSNQDAESASPACESKSFTDDNNKKQTRCQLVRK